MNIIICGRQGVGKTSVSKSLLDFFSYRGTAALIKEHLSVLEEAHDAVWMVGQQYGIRPITDNEDYKDPRLMHMLYGWRGSFDWTRLTKNALDQLTDSWDSKNVHYAAIVVGLTDPVSINAFFQNSFKVYLECKDDVRESRILPGSKRSDSDLIECGFNDCAVSNIFDLVIDTSEAKPDEVANLIGNKFQDKINTIFMQKQD